MPIAPAAAADSNMLEVFPRSNIALEVSPVFVFSCTCNIRGEQRLELGLGCTGATGFLAYSIVMVDSNCPTWLVVYRKTRLTEFRTLYNAWSRTLHRGWKASPSSISGFDGKAQIGASSLKPTRALTRGRAPVVTFADLKGLGVCRN